MKNQQEVSHPTELMDLEGYRRRGLRLLHRVLLIFMPVVTVLRFGLFLRTGEWVQLLTTVVTVSVFFATYSLRRRAERGAWESSAQITLVMVLLLFLVGTSLNAAQFEHSPPVILYLFVTLVLFNVFVVLLSIPKNAKKWGYLSILAFLGWTSGYIVLVLSKGKIPPFVYVLLVLAAIFLFIINYLLTFILGYLYKVIDELRASRESLSHSNRYLRITEQEAVQANQAKTIFLANMSHELRTPLNAILGYSELIEEELEEEANLEHHDDLHKIQHAGRHLLGLISNILDLTKIESENFELDIQKVELSSALELVISVIEPLCRQNKNQFLVQMNTSVQTVEADIQKLQQCLLNVLGNASKFTKKGVVSLVVEDDVVEGKSVLRFVISDTGIGMAPETLGRIFDAFWQERAESVQLQQGSGLGLAITKKLWNLMGGEIIVSSEFEKGSIFTLTIPVTISPQQMETIRSYSSMELPSAPSPPQ